MTASLTWYELRWPREITPEQLRALAGVLATMAGQPTVLEVQSGVGPVIHRVGLSTKDRGGLLAQLRSTVPGMSVVKSTRELPDIDRAFEVRLSTRKRGLGPNPEPVAHAVLSALANVGRDESLLLQWQLGPSLPPVPVPSSSSGDQSTTSGLVGFVLGLDGPTDNEARTALRKKRGEPGWRVIGRVGVQAASKSRQQQLFRRLAGAVRTAEAPGVTLRFNWTPRRSLIKATSWRYPTRLNLSELVTVSGWPVGRTSSYPVVSAGSRSLPPSRAIPRDGRVLAMATSPGRERSLALSATDGRQHLEVLGPTGTGKSTLLVNLIVQDMKAGRGLLVLDPKGDVYRDVIAATPANRLADVVPLDPTELSPVGLNPLQARGRPAELVADQLLAVFHGLYAAHWGPRTQDLLHGALLTLVNYPGATLAALPLVLSDVGFRRKVISQIDDPVALGPFWSAFDNWSPAEQTSATAPVLNKLRPFLLRRQLRSVIGQAAPRFDIRQIFTERKILVVNLAKGILGPETSALLGALVISQFWQATLSRAAIPPERRHPVFCYLDEFSDYLHLGTDLSDALSQARGLGVGLVLSHQFLGQLDPAMRSAVLANARSKISFRLAPEDARVLAAGGDEPAGEDFSSLAAFECYLQLVAGGTVQPWCSGRTLPAPKPTNDVDAVRQTSADRYGIPREETEEALRTMAFGTATSEDDLVPRRRGDDR